MASVNQAARIAEAVRQSCIQAALDGYEDAGQRGLCHEGAWEAAVDAIRRLDLAPLLRMAGDPAEDTGAGPH